MGFLSAWVRDIVILVIYVTFLEMLVPKGNMKKYIRLVSGLLIVMAIIHPILSLIGEGLNLEDIMNFNEVFLTGVSTEEVRRKGEEIKQRGEEALLDSSISKTEEKVRGVLMAFEDIEDSQVTLESQNGKISKAKVRILLVSLEERREGIEPVNIGYRSDETAASIKKIQTLERKVKSVIGSLLDINEKNIQVVFGRVDSIGI